MRKERGMDTSLCAAPTPSGREDISREFETGNKNWSGETCSLPLPQVGRLSGAAAAAVVLDVVKLK